MRAAHIHMMVRHPDYCTVVNQLYPEWDPHLKDDSVFGIKDDLVVDFKRVEGNPKAQREVEFDFKVASKALKQSLGQKPNTFYDL